MTRLRRRSAHAGLPKRHGLLAHYNRSELYERVWSEPIRDVAKQHGVSDVWLAKICRALRVPLPGRGYWAKKNAGRLLHPATHVPSQYNGLAIHGWILNRYENFLLYSSLQRVT